MKNPFKNLFTKPVPEPVTTPNKTLAQIAKESDYFNRWQKPKIDRETILSTIFRRPTESVKMLASTGQEMSFALDSDVKQTFNLMPAEIPDTVLEFYGRHSFIGWQACAILRQNYLINAACTVPAQDAIATDYCLHYAENNDKEDEAKKEVDEERLLSIKDAATCEYGISDLCKRLTINKKTFGIGLAVPIVDGADMSKPFNIDGIRKGSYKGMTLVEPYWCAPQMDGESASNPASAHFYEPTWWRIHGKLVHRTWCIKVVNNVVPDILKPTYYYGGVPLTQMLYERVYAAEKTANEAPLLAMTKRMLVADADVDNMLANPESAQDIVRAVSWFRDNHGVWFKRSGDQVAQIDTSLADLDAVIMTQYQLCASIAEMPATKLLKTTPKGFNATGDYEFKDYAQTLQAIQENDYKPLIKRHLELYTKSELGKEIALTVAFNPVDVPTEKEVAEVEEIYSRIDGNYVNTGIISSEESRDMLRSKEGSRYSTLPEESEQLKADEAESDALADQFHDDTEKVSE